MKQRELIYNDKLQKVTMGKLLRFMYGTKFI